MKLIKKFVTISILFTGITGGIFITQKLNSLECGVLVKPAQLICQVQRLPKSLAWGSFYGLIISGGSLWILQVLATSRNRQQITSNKLPTDISIKKGIRESLCTHVQFLSLTSIIAFTILPLITRTTNSSGAIYQLPPLTIEAPYLYDNSPKGSWDFTLVNKQTDSVKNIPIPAPCDGKITNKTFEGTTGTLTSGSGFGLLIEIACDNQSIGWLMAHLASTRLKIGDRLMKGMKIGVQGQTGRASGPHVHAQIHRRKGNQLGEQISDRTITKPYIKAYFDFVESPHKRYQYEAGEGLYRVRYNYSGRNWTHADVEAIPINTRKPIAILPVQYTANGKQPGATVNGTAIGKQWNEITVNEMKRRLEKLGFFVLTPTIQMYGETHQGFQALEHFIAGVHKGNYNVQTVIMTADANTPAATNPRPGAQMLVTGLHERDRAWENLIQSQIKPFYQQQKIANIGPIVRGGKSNKEGSAMAWHPLIERAAEYNSHIAIIEVARASEIVQKAGSISAGRQWASPLFDAVAVAMKKWADRKDSAIELRSATAIESR